MVKALFCGDFSISTWSLLYTKLNDLQKSSHGPFDIIFCIGKNILSDNNNIDQIIEQINELEIQFYFFDSSLSSIFSSSSITSSFIEFLNPQNKSCGLINLSKFNLTVSYIISQPTIEDLNQIKETVSAKGYRGCDLLFSYHSPSSLYHFLDENQLSLYRSSQIPSGTKFVTDFASLVIPRYHFLSSKSLYQRPPFPFNFPSTTSPILYSRFITLASVSESKEKEKKWIHALNLMPIIYMSKEELSNPPADATENPYVEVKDSTDQTKKRYQSSEINNESNIKKFKKLEEENELLKESSLTSSFFSNTYKSNTQNLLNSNENLTNDTLFIGGITKNSNEDIEKLKKLFKNIKKINPINDKNFLFIQFLSHNDAQNVINLSMKKKIQLNGKTLTINWAKNTSNQEGSTLNSDGNQDVSEMDYNYLIKNRSLEPAFEDSCILFVGNLPKEIKETNEINEILLILEEEIRKIFQNIKKIKFFYTKYYCFIEFFSHNDALHALNLSLNEEISLRGSPLVVGWSKFKNKTLDEEIIPHNYFKSPSSSSTILYIKDATNEDIQEIFYNKNKNSPDYFDYSLVIESILIPEGRNFAFVQFINHMEAVNALQRLTNNFSSIYIVNSEDKNPSNEEKNIEKKKLHIKWANINKLENKSNEIVQHDCWFCLACPSTKLHLVLSVGNFSYLTLPRGGINKEHTMICPIECLSSRVFLSNSIKDEIKLYQEKLETFYNDKNKNLKTNYQCIVYERAIFNKIKRDHIQIHIVPINFNEIKSDPISLFHTLIRKYSLNFYQLKENEILDDVLVNMEGGPYQEYFYIEIPVENDENEVKNEKLYKKNKYLYVYSENQDNISIDQRKFPMLFGSEVNLLLLFF